MEPTRRRILELALAAADVAAAQQHAHQAVRTGAAAGKLGALTPEEAADVEALAATIIPSGGTPGAREAGVVHFIDKALATFDHDKLDDYREGLRAARSKLAGLSSSARTIAALDGQDRIRLVQAIENTPFFEMLRVHTVMGFLGPPSYGGNRNQAGWSLIGFKE